MRCTKHPSKAAVTQTFGGLCEECAKQVKIAQGTVDKHVSPKECFVWYYDGKTGWVRIEGTGCAHWVAHQLNLKGVYSEVCAEGYKFRVADVIAGARKIDPEQEGVRYHDIWVSPDIKHCGLVIAIHEEGGKKIYRIKHCASGSGGVVEHNHTSLYKGQGSYHRF